MTVIGLKFTFHIAILFFPLPTVSILFPGVLWFNFEEKIWFQSYTYFCALASFKILFLQLILRNWITICFGIIFQAFYAWDMLQFLDTGIHILSNWENIQPLFLPIFFCPLSYFEDFMLIKLIKTVSQLTNNMLMFFIFSFYL